MADAADKSRFDEELAKRAKKTSADQTEDAPNSDESFTQPSLDDQALPSAPDGTTERPADEDPPNHRDGSGELGPDKTERASTGVVPSSLELAPVEPGDPSAPYRAMDRADEIQIIEEIEGRMSEVLVYKIPTGTDLSFAGVREAIRLLVVASGQGYWGTAEQPARMKLKPDTAQRYRKNKKFVADDDTVRDEFAFTKALSKAQRNALKYFVPEQVRQGVLAIAKNDPKRLREITMGPGAPMVDAPKPLDDQGGRALISECRELYKQICDADPSFKARKPPGQFHASLQSAWSNRDALESLRDSMLDVLDKTQTAA
jgi:hypothetical protein